MKHLKKGQYKQSQTFFLNQIKNPFKENYAQAKQHPLPIPPPLRAPPEAQPEKSKRGNKRKASPTPEQEPSSPKSSRMGESPNKLLREEKNKQKFMEEMGAHLGSILTEQGNAQKKTLEEHLAQTNDNLEKKLEKALTTVSETFNKKLDASIQPVEARLGNNESQIEILKTQMGEYSKTQETMGKLVLESHANLTTVLAHINSNPNNNTQDPSTSHQRKKLYEELQRENCVLTIQGCTETKEGIEGWNRVLETCTFRNGYVASKFNTGILRSIQLPKEVKFTTVTFASKIERDTFSRNVEKKNQPLRFFDSHPQPYREPNRAMRREAQDLRDMDFITDITIDESTLIMHLKYRQKKKDKERYDWQTKTSYDPFDPDSIYNKSLKASKVLNKTAILIKAKYGVNVSRIILKTEWDKFNEQNTCTLPNNEPVINEKTILVQYETPEDAASVKELLDKFSPNFLQGNTNFTIM